MKHIAILIIGLVMLAKPAHALGSGFGEEFDTVLDVIDRCFKNFNDEDYDFCTPYGFTYKTIETETQSRFGDVLKFKTDIIQAGDGIKKYKHNNVTLRCNGGCNSASEVKSRVFEMMAAAHANSGYTSTLTMLNGTAQRGSANKNNGRDWSATLDNAESALDIGAQLTELFGAFGSSQNGRN